jgi:hypothetical protein
MSAPPDPVVFVGGVERSGTTLLRNMLDAHPFLALPDESYFIRNAYKELRRRGKEDDLSLAWRLIQNDRFFKQWELAPALVERVIDRSAPQTYADLIRVLFAAYAEREEKPLSADKTPSHAYCFDWYADHFPDSRFVHVLRDPREVCMALAVQPWYRGGLAGAAGKWATTVRRARAAGASLGERYLEVRYERLIADPEATLREVCELARIPFAQQMLAYPALTRPHAARHFAMSRTPPRVGVRRWRDELNPADVALIELIAGGVMAEAGYETLATKAPLRLHIRYGLERARTRSRVRLDRRLENLAPIEP